MAMKEIDIREVKENLVHLLADEWALGHRRARRCAGHHDRQLGRYRRAVGQGYGHHLYSTPALYKEVFGREQLLYPEFLPGAVQGRPASVRQQKRAGDQQGRGHRPDPLLLRKSPIYFEEAKLVLVCRKVAVSAFEPSQFLDSGIMQNYAQNDFHAIYYGAIEKVLISE